MAARRSSRKTEKKAAKPARASRRAAAAASADDTIEEVGTGGLGIDEGVIITTTITLIAACVMVFMAIQKYPA